MTVAKIRNWMFRNCLDWAYECFVGAFLAEREIIDLKVTNKNYRRSPQIFELAAILFLLSHWITTQQTVCFTLRILLFQNLPHHPRHLHNTFRWKGMLNFVRPKTNFALDGSARRDTHNVPLFSFIYILRKTYLHVIQVEFHLHIIIITPQLPTTR